MINSAKNGNPNMHETIGMTIDSGETEIAERQIVRIVAVFLFEKAQTN